ncbi:MAG: thioredoxin family protein [Halieaceae bacterium]
MSALLRDFLTRGPAIKRSSAAPSLARLGRTSSAIARLAVMVACVALSDSALAEEHVVLVYIYSPSCGACQQFDREVGPIYPKTTEAQTLPMQKIRYEAWRDGTAPFAHCAVSPVLGTPTFIQIRGCEELDRVTGYSDQELFWLALRRMLNRLDAT